MTRGRIEKKNGKRRKRIINYPNNKRPSLKGGLRSLPLLPFIPGASTVNSFYQTISHL